MFRIGYDSTWFPLLDAAAIARDFPELELHGANAFAVRSGARASTGSVLMAEADYRAMMTSASGTPFSTPWNGAETEGYYPYAPIQNRKFTLGITATDSFGGWNVVGATRLMQTAKTDGSTPVLVELADTRYFYNRYKLYYGENIYGPGGTPLTTLSADWNDLIEARWNAAKTVGGNPGLNLSTWVDLSSVPTEAPAGFDFRRSPVSVVEQIETLLNRCGYTLSHRSDGYLYAEQIGAGTLPTYPNAALWMSYQPSDNQYNNRPSAYQFVYPQISDGQYVTVSSSQNAAADIDGTGTQTVEYEFNPSATSFAAGVLDAWHRRSHRRDDIYAGYVAASPVGSWHTSVEVWNRGFGLFTRITSEPVPLMPAAMQFDGITWTNTVNAQQWVVVGTPTAGSFTWTITRPDGTTVTTAAISYTGTPGSIAGLIQTAVDNAIGTGFATISGTSYSSIIITWSATGGAWAVTSANIGSFTGATSSSFSAYGPSSQKPTGVNVDRSTGIGFELYNTSGSSPSSKLRTYPASFSQQGTVTAETGGIGQTLGRGPKYFSSGITVGRVAPEDDLAHREDYNGYQKTYITGPDWVDEVYSKDYDVNLMTVSLEDPDTPFGPIAATARFVGVQDGVADGSYWEFVGGEDPELGYSPTGGVSVRFVTAQEDRSDGDGFVPGSFVEISSATASRFRVVRTAAGSTAYPNGTGTYDGIDTGITGADGTVYEFCGGIVFNAISPGTPPTAEPAATDLATAIALVNQIRTIIIAMGRLA